MMTTNIIRIRAISDPSAECPAITPDTLLEFNDLNCSFLQYYRIHGEKVDWYGRFENLGLTFTTPLTMLYPPELSELLGAQNFDTVAISLADIAPVKRISLQKVKAADPDEEACLELMPGLKASTRDRFIYKGHLVVVTSNSPKTGFITPDTFIEDDIIEPETLSIKHSTKQNPPESKS